MLKHTQAIVQVGHATLAGALRALAIARLGIPLAPGYLSIPR